MKICLINNLYKPFNRGGAEKVTETIANGLKRAGHEVFIITTKPYFKKNPPAGGQTIYYLNSLYYDLRGFPKFFRFFWHVWDMFDLINYFKIKRILKRETCGAVITNNLAGLGHLTGRAIKKLKIKHLHIAHDIQLIHPSGLIYYGQEEIVNSLAAGNYAGLSGWLFNSPQIVIFPSRWLMDIHLEKIFFVKSKRIILPNPVENFLSRTATSGGRFRFLYIGQLEEHKGVLLLIEAFRKINLAAELIIAGAGSLDKEVRAAAGRDGRIKFLGRVSEAEVDKLLTEADCLVYPSLVYENCPNVIQRALAAGLPVIAADLGGAGELLGKNAGLMFKPADGEDLAEKLAWAADKKDRLRDFVSFGREKAALYGVDNYLKELEKLITSHT